MSYKKRCLRLRKNLKKNEAFYISGADDIFYLSGFSGTSAKIIAGPGRPLFITDKRYEGSVKSSPIARVYDILIVKNPKKELKKILSGCSKIHTSADIRLSEFLTLQNFRKKIIFSEKLAAMRMIKSPEEIKLIKKSLSIAEKGIKHIVSLLKPGVTEKELALEFEFFTRKNSADSVSFPPIIAFGKNSAIPHHAPSGRKLRKGDLILVDAGVKYRGYCSDLTRCIAFCIMKPHLISIKNHYNTVKNAKKAGANMYKNGLLIGKAEEKARNYLKKKGLNSYFTHSLGHSLGIAVHEAPYVRLKERSRFRNNMVFTCEPGIYLDNKYGIRIEDDYLIKGRRAVKLSALNDALIEKG